MKVNLALAPAKPLLFGVAVVALVACGGPRSGDSPKASAPTTSAETGTDTSEGASSAPTPIPRVQITAFGVPECDAYVKKFLTCVEEKVPAEQKQGLIEAFDANRTKWRGLATMREGALALSLACRTAAQKSKDELALDYGCEF